MLKFIPRDIIHRTARETGVDLKARTYSVLSHLGTMVFAQLARGLSLNDVCDWLRLKARTIAASGLTSPSRINLCNSNKVRDARFAELVFWRRSPTSSTVIAALDGSAPAAVPDARCCTGSK
jgi:hypothetical protein